MVNRPGASVSIVCVFNDVAVRKRCLDRSIEALEAEAADVEYLPIDNVTGSYPSAGAALNHGISQVGNDVVVFVHQDVFLHSLTALKEAAALMEPGGFGVLGAVGIRQDGRIVGYIRDRVVLLGEQAVESADVDSLDEVLFMAPRAQLLSNPLTEHPDMAWHGYAVEYGLRVRRQGLRVGVADIPLTHNSLTVNLARLDTAHRAIGAEYHDMLPVRTTCGAITESTVTQDSHVLFPAHRWRYRWLRESLVVQGGLKAAGRRPAVLADIRLDIDAVIERAPDQRIDIINRSGPRFAGGDGSSLDLVRGTTAITVSAVGIAEIPPAITGRPAKSWLLVTNLSRDDLQLLRSALPDDQGVLGFHTGIGFWLLLGPTAADLPVQWRSPQATPLGVRTLPEVEARGAVA
jgi:hypothetical protein